MRDKMNAPTRLRTMKSDDQPFLYRLFASTRSDIAMLDISAEEKDRLLRMQFNAQSDHYRQQFGEADFLIVTQEGDPIGRITVHHQHDEIRVVDIALLPNYRSSGIGTRLMLDVIKDGRLAEKAVRLHVEKTNRAVLFYERLGFVPIAETDFHWFMELAPHGQRLDD